MDSLFSHLEVLKDKVQDAVFAVTSCVCQPSATIKVNGRTFKIVKILGEGGFSFVYLAQDEQSGREFALKKIRCPTGQEGVREAMREVEAYRRFKHPNIIRILDSAVVDDRDGEGKIVYLFLPYYRRGNLQDIINANSIHNSHLSEHEILTYFLGTCKGLSAMHGYRMVVPKSSKDQSGSSKSPGPRPPSRQENHAQDDEEDHEQSSMLPHPEGDHEGGFSYHGRSSRGAPLATRPPIADRVVETVFDGDEELDTLQHASTGNMELVPYAHRDIKPGNVMLSDDGAPILMDFGSTIKARIHIENRNQALMQQVKELTYSITKPLLTLLRSKDLAAEQSTMPYRAPELFDVKTGTTIDEKVDIWSLGCLLFALAYSHSPFETTQTTEQGGSLAMVIMNAQYKYPRESPYSESFKAIIDSCLKVNAKDRPSVDDLIHTTETMLQSLN
ncbi:hypothetical protein FRB96_004497 [Tulasnella sp. 330]|nr:hypothetical protein FRB96_004497 [Tulasnella sp. 330]KAG8886346.1 hypothetical protein FRB97_004881 [Tulasnella sp. 331]KAG8890784.1 hypothetical protein FRB98_004829 [Tulasnella sp. 332]